MCSIDHQNQPCLAEGAAGCAAGSTLKLLAFEGCNVHAAAVSDTNPLLGACCDAGAGLIAGSDTTSALLGVVIAVREDGCPGSGKLGLPTTRGLAAAEFACV